MHHFDKASCQPGELEVTNEVATLWQSYYLICSTMHLLVVPRDLSSQRFTAVKRGHFSTLRDHTANCSWAAMVPLFGHGPARELNLVFAIMGLSRTLIIDEVDDTNWSDENVRLRRRLAIQNDHFESQRKLILLLS